MNIERDNKKPVKIKKVKLKKPNLIIPNFSCISTLKGNNKILESSFNITKYIYINQ